jgi:Holliday junction DNA helicase RuvA
MATTLGPLVALRGHLMQQHEGFAWPLDDTQLLVECEAARLYLVEFSSARVVQTLLNLPQPSWVYVAEIVREDAHQYFGFSSAVERALFEELKEIKDIGPKTAALVVAELGTSDVLRLMHEGAWAGFKVAGVGPKTLDTLIFGLNKRKKSILPLLDKGLAAHVAHKKMPTLRGSAFQASDSLIKMFEGLGLGASQVQKLFEECSEVVEGFREMEDRARVPVMLQRWGQSRWVRYASTL